MCGGSWFEFEDARGLFADESGSMQPIYCLRHGHRAASQGKHEFFDAPAFIRVAFQEYQQLDGPNGADLSMNKGQYFVFVQSST